LETKEDGESDNDEDDQVEDKNQQKRSEQKLRYASVPYKVNPDPNYGSMSTE
jgi:hypothetical protein